MKRMRRYLDIGGVLCLAVLAATGCAMATATATRSAPGGLPQPDRIIVHDFAVSPADVTLDRGLGPTLMRDTSSDPQSQEDVQVGQAVAKTLTDNLVKKLQEHGIIAQRAGAGPPPGPTTASITGEFVRIDQGNRTLRTLVGFGLGGGELRTRVFVYQGGGQSAKLVAEGETNTQASLKPGMAVMLPVGAAAGTLATTTAVAGGTTAASEVFFATVEADARRTADAVVDKIASYYRRQGWLWR